MFKKTADLAEDGTPNTGGDDDDGGIKGKKQQHILREINCQPAN